MRRASHHAHSSLQLWATRVHDRADEQARSGTATAAGGAAGARTLRSVNVASGLLTDVLPWPRLRAVAVERLDARAEAAAALHALAAAAP